MFTAKINMHAIYETEDVHAQTAAALVANIPAEKMLKQRAAQQRTVCLATLHGSEKHNVEEAARVWLKNNSWFWKASERAGEYEFFDRITIDVTYRETVRIPDMLDRERI